MHAGQGEHNPFPTLAVKYVIEANGVTYDAFGLATDCLKEWQSFPEGKRPAHDLLTPTRRAPASPRAKGSCHTR
jgi:hypothetical protein